MAKKSEEFFIWIPKGKNYDWKIEINSIDETNSFLGGEFSPAIIGEESGFELELNNNNEAYNSKFIGNETINFYLDRGTATNIRFTGKIEKLTKESGSRGNILKVSGAHRFHSKLLDITVTEDYRGDLTGDVILKNMIDKYLTGFTYTNVVATTIKPNLKWEDVPFFDAVVDICNACEFDSYVDVAQDFHFFERESILNDSEAIVYRDTYIGVSGLTTDLIDIRNRVTVSSEDNEGLPILYTSQDSASQTTYGIKEMIIKETSISTTTQAQQLADYSKVPEAEEKGEAISWFLPELLPGDFMWISEPSQEIHSRYRIVKYTHKLFDMTTKCVIAQSRDIPTFLKERRQSEASLESLKNPYKMLYSFNDTFDNENTIASKSTNLTIAEGQIYLSSGTTAIMTSTTFSAPIDITSVHLKVVGEALAGTIFRCSTDGGTSWTTLTIDTLITVPAGNRIVLETSFNSSSTVIKSYSLMGK